jgi:TetR/AcrR family transcriptional regulator
LVKYYFKDRSELIVAVVRLLLDETERRIEGPGAAAASPVEVLRWLVEDLLALQRDEPYFHDLLQDEIINGASEAGRQLFKDLTLRGIAVVADLVRRGVAAGLMRPVDPVHLYLSIIGVSQSLRAGGVIMGLVGRNLKSEAEHQAYVEAVFAMVMNGVAGPAQPAVR